MSCPDLVLMTIPSICAWVLSSFRPFTTLFYFYWMICFHVLWRLWCFWHCIFIPFSKYSYVHVDFSKQCGLWVCSVYSLLVVCWLSTSPSLGSLLLLGSPHISLHPGDYTFSLHLPYLVFAALRSSDPCPTMVPYIHTPPSSQCIAILYSVDREEMFWNPDQPHSKLERAPDKGTTDWYLKRPHFFEMCRTGILS